MGEASVRRGIGRAGVSRRLVLAAGAGLLAGGRALDVLRRGPGAGEAPWHVEGRLVTIGGQNLVLPATAMGGWRAPIGERDCVYAVFGVPDRGEQLAAVIAWRAAGLAVVALEPWAWLAGDLLLSLRIAGSEAEPALRLYYDVRLDAAPGRRHEAWRDRLVWDDDGPLRQDDRRAPPPGTWQAWRAASRARVRALLARGDGVPDWDALRACGLLDAPPTRARA